MLFLLPELQVSPDISRSMVFLSSSFLIRSWEMLLLRFFHLARSCQTQAGWNYFSSLTQPGASAQQTTDNTNCATEIKFYWELKGDLSTTKYAKHKCTQTMRNATEYLTSRQTKLRHSRPASDLPLPSSCCTGCASVHDAPDSGAARWPPPHHACRSYSCS